MFYLSKFCRICVKSCGRLIDLDSADHDRLKFSDKLRAVCTKMVINNNVSTLICYNCVQKLRVSYTFHRQCMDSDQIFKRYIDEITSVCPESKFINSELQVTIPPIPKITMKQEAIRLDPDPVSCISQISDHSYNLQSHSSKTEGNIDLEPSTTIKNSTKVRIIHDKPVKVRRRLKHEASFRISEAYKARLTRLGHMYKRVSKETRCHLLRSLLLKNDTNSITPRARRTRNINQNQANTTESKTTIPKVKVKSSKEQPEPKPKVTKPKGGLRELLGFIRNYDFGFPINDSDIQEECDHTALDRLESFSKTFFYSDFRDYRETILSLANDSESSDDEDMYSPYNHEEDRLLWPECEQLNNNYNKIRVKQEFHNNNFGTTNVRMEVEEPNNLPLAILKTPINVKQESEAELEDENDDGFLPSEFVQTCYDDQPTEQANLRQTINLSFQHFVNKMNNLSDSADSLADPASIVKNVNRLSVIPGTSTSAAANMSSLDLLTRLTNSARLPKDGASTSTSKPYTRCHLKCRTRGNRFINPQLMEQFQSRSFKCDTCNRSFKSPGYLHSHCTKMGHSVSK